MLRGRFFVSGAEDIYVETHCPGDSGGQLAEEGIACVDVGAFAILCAEQAAFLRVLPRIVAGEQGSKGIIPTAHEGEATLLYPSGEVVRGDGVWVVKDRIVRGKDLDWSFFDGNARAA